MALLFNQFNKQWVAFVESFDKLGKKIEDAQKEFQALTTTRVNKLEKPLYKIEELRKGLPVSDVQMIE
jgi:DNA recombination protein RmuC